MKQYLQKLLLCILHLLSACIYRLFKHKKDTSASSKAEQLSRVHKEDDYDSKSDRLS